jgi:hypothetical protein
MASQDQNGRDQAIGIVNQMLSTLDPTQLDDKDLMALLGVLQDIGGGNGVSKNCADYGPGRDGSRKFSERAGNGMSAARRQQLLGATEFGKAASRSSRCR